EDGRRGRITGGGAARNGPGPNERDGRRRHCDARRGRGGSAGGPTRVGDGERHSIGAVVRVWVSWPDAGAGAPVAEAPGVGERIAIRIRRAAAVEADRKSLGYGKGGTPT